MYYHSELLECGLQLVQDNTGLFLELMSYYHVLYVP